MQYRLLGRTGLEVSLVGFGAAPLGDVYGPVDPFEADRVVHLAIEKGINLFDVSPYYGLTLAEERLGKALDGRRKEVILATKCGRYGLEEFDFSAARVARSVEESLRRLRTDHVDLLQVHDVEFGNIEQIIHETIPAMRRLQAQGKARFIGISGYPLQPLIRIAQAVPLDTILSYCRYNLLGDHLDTVLMPVADALGIGVINASALHMGVLTGRGAPDWHPAPEAVREAAGRAAELCHRHGCELSTIALHFCFDYSRVASTLVGMPHPEHVLENIRALTAPIDPEIFRQVREILAPVFNRVWPSGLAENHDPMY
ncbi:MAG: aldo/keto reductase [Acidobacteriaceae bacterium]